MRFRYILLILGGVIVLLAATAGFLYARNLKSAGNEPFQRETSNEFTLTDIKARNSATSCWVSYGAQVYDITRFIASLEQSKATELTSQCGTNLDTLPSAIKTADILSDYSIGILAP